MKKSTQELLHRLSEANDIRIFLDENQHEILSETTHDYLSELLREKEMTAAEIARRSGQGDYVYKVLQGKRRASRDILIAVAIGMGLTVPETQLLLRIAQMAQLDPRNRRDSVVIYSLSHYITLEKTNEILYDITETAF